MTAIEPASARDESPTSDHARCCRCDTRQRVCSDDRGGLVHLDLREHRRCDRRTTSPASTVDGFFVSLPTSASTPSKPIRPHADHASTNATPRTIETMVPPTLY